MTTKTSGLSYTCPCLGQQILWLRSQETTLGLLSKARRTLNESKSFSEMDPLDKLVSLLINRQEALASSRIEGTIRQLMKW